ncbi:MAG: NAD-dependent epimerase/dehydratase family protein [Verrucomicrobia bacterium]|nr:NAD-dependent epimerase/dehydratase family protein [Verrucomicrobiota bacterium]NBS04033.1 NAD-dependent epimerase/dehydratase family protein [Verrucomicrobiota bacterium]NBY37572.1 NAD-dependent epimerase/dehydratase family protein [Verrucomicrobiota bacterium]
MRILITGGAGFIGSHLARHFQGKAEVVVLDNFRTGDRRNLDGLDCNLIEASILDQARVAEAMKGVDQVFHLAALVSVPESVSNPTETKQLNVQGTLTILEAAVRGGVQKVVLASSAAIYGNNPVVPKCETMTPEPQSPYASTKLSGEQLLETFHQRHALSTTSLRFFNVFGPRQNPQSAYAAAVPIFITQALQGKPLVIFGDGTQTRDFIYVQDITQALAYVAERESVIGTYNVGHGQGLSILSLAEKIIALTGSKSSIEYRPGRAGDVKDSVASPEKLQSVGWKASVSFDQALSETIRYFKSVTA